MTSLIVGCGYLGRRVAARWRAPGRRVLATTRSPQHASELAALGLERSRTFSWRRAAAETVKVYRHAVAGEARLGAPARELSRPQRDHVQPRTR